MRDQWRSRLSPRTHGSDSKIEATAALGLVPSRWGGLRKRAALLLSLVVVTAGCGFRQITPPGAAPMRYRDAVFTAVTKTEDVTYGSAVDEQGRTVALTLDVYRPTGDTSTHRPA